LIPYDSMNTAKEYVDGMKALGFTHIYIRYWLPGMMIDDVNEWRGAAGLGGQVIPFLPWRRKELTSNFEIKYKVLLAEAIAERRISVVGGTDHWLAIEIPR
jgi:hypothetical protein